MKKRRFLCVAGLLVGLWLACLLFGCAPKGGQSTPLDPAQPPQSEAPQEESGAGPQPVDGQLFFGSYPQSEVTDSTLHSTLTRKAGDPSAWTSYRYYFYDDEHEQAVQGDAMRYKDVTHQGEKYRGVYFTEYRLGCNSMMTDDPVYALNTIYWFKFEPISWRVLEEKKGKAFLIADFVLDGQQYCSSVENRTMGGETVYPNNYKESDIRAWLNRAFWDTAFTSAQQQWILTTEVDNGEGTTFPEYSHPYQCENTNDKVFLLSYQDINNSAYGFSDAREASPTREKFPTDYAKAQGALQPTNAATYAARGKGCNWWLRSPHPGDSGYSLFVAGNGVPDCWYTIVPFGVVPALWVRLG